jgi:hypothetical protein
MDDFIDVSAFLDQSMSESEGLEHFDSAEQGGHPR